MTIDALALAALCNEAEEAVRGCRIQKIIPTGPLSMVLEVYNSTRKQRVQFLLSADAQNARFHLLRQKASQQPGEPSPFLLLLRKYIRYGIIDKIEQTPFERIVSISIAKKFPVGKRPYFGAAGAAPVAKDSDYDEADEDREDAPDDEEDFEIYESRLVCEMMGRHSNIMLLSEDDVIIDAIKRVAPSKNRYRLILPHQPYVTPPPQNKRNFFLESPASFAGLFDQLREKNPKGQIWQTLVETFSGVSPQLAREVAFRLAERKGQESTDVTLDSMQRWDNLYIEMRTLLRPLNPALRSAKPEQPEGPAAWLAREPDGNVVAFAPYELHQFRPEGLESEAVESLSRAAEEFYSQMEAVGGQSQRKQEIAAQVNEHYEKLRRRATSLEASLKKAESAEEFKRKGEAIYAHLYEITPGMTELAAEGLKIALDPARTPSENAQAYFREYDKARQAMAGVPELLEETRFELQYLDEMLTQLDLAESFEEVMNLKAELSEANYGPKVKEKGKQPRPKRRKLPQTPTFTSPDGYTIYVGKSAQHNEFVTFELGDREDLWLHARGMPGSHVVIKTGGREVPEKTLEMAAALAAYYSKGQTSTKVEVTYAPQRYVRKVKGPHPGLVTYSNDKSVSVKPKRPANKPAK